MFSVARTPKPALYSPARDPLLTLQRGLRRVPTRWPRASGGPTLEISPRTLAVVRVRCPRDVLPQRDRLPIPSVPPSYSVLSQPRRWGFPSKPSAQSSVLALTPRREPGSCDSVRLAAGQARSLQVRYCAPQRRGLGPGVGVSLSRCCPVPCRASASQLPYPPRAPARVPPQPRNREAQCPAGSHSYLQGPPRLSASPPPSCISERLHFSGSQL